MLVVDDDRDFADSLTNLLALEGYEVEAAYSAGEAKDLAERFDAQVAILDYRLGHDNGLDLVAPLTERRPGLVCVLSTAYSDTETAIKAMRDGAYDYLRKPLHAREILATIERCFEKRRLEQDKAAAEAALREAKRMEAVANVTGGVAHHSNNLLMIIQGNLELLKEGLPEDQEQYAAYADSALGAVGRAAAINHALLAFSSQSMLRPRSVDLDAVVAEVVVDTRRRVGNLVRIETSATGDLWPVWADPGQLRAAVLSLATNACEAMPEGGALSFAAANVEDPASGERAEGRLPPGRYCRLVVADTGVGMAPEIAERAFEPFFSGRGMAEKAGLGLSTVYGFLRQSGGHVAIETALGRGTSVTLFLPACAEPGTQ